MVPPHAAAEAAAPPGDAAPVLDERRLLARLGRLLDLGARRTLLLLWPARPALLRGVYGTLRAFDPGAHILLHPGELAHLPEGATALLRVKAEDAPALNLGRPIYARRGLRVVLWPELDDLADLRAGAPDFYDWIGHTLDLPERPPTFAVAGLRLAAGLSAQAGVAWMAGDLDAAAAAAGLRLGPTLHPAERYPALVARRRAQGADWGRWAEVDDLTRLHRVRWVEAEAAEGARAVLEGPSCATPGFARLHGRALTLGEAAERLGRAGVPDPGRWAAILDLEPEALDLASRWVAGGRALPDSLEGEPDPGAALARLPGLLEAGEGEQAVVEGRASPPVLRALSDHPTTRAAIRRDRLRTARRERLLVTNAFPEDADADAVARLASTDPRLRLPPKPDARPENGWRLIGEIRAARASGDGWAWARCARAAQALVHPDVVEAWCAAADAQAEEDLALADELAVARALSACEDDRVAEAWEGLRGRAARLTSPGQHMAWADVLYLVDQPAQARATLAPLLAEPGRWWREPEVGWALQIEARSSWELGDRELARVRALESERAARAAGDRLTALQSGALRILLDNEEAFDRAAGPALERERAALRVRAEALQAEAERWLGSRRYPLAQLLATICAALLPRDAPLPERQAILRRLAEDERARGLASGWSARERSSHLLEMGEAQAALSEARAALEISARSAGELPLVRLSSSHLLAGRAALALRETRAAAESFHASLTLEDRAGRWTTTRVQALAGLGVCTEQERDLAAAAAHLDHAIEAARRGVGVSRGWRADAHYVRGRVAQSQGDRPRALAELEQALSVCGPADWRQTADGLDAQVRLGWLLVVEKRPRDALSVLAALRRDLEESGADPAGYPWLSQRFWQARALRALGDLRGASESLEVGLAAIEAAGARDSLNHARFLKELGDLRLEERSYEAALEAYDRALLAFTIAQPDTENAEIAATRLGLARAAVALGAPDRAFALHPMEGRLGRARRARALGDALGEVTLHGPAIERYEDALALYQQALSDAPNAEVAETWKVLAKATAESGDLPEALRALQEEERIRARLHGPNNLFSASALHRKGQVLVGAMRFGEAIEPLERALSIKRSPEVSCTPENRIATELELARALHMHAQRPGARYAESRAALRRARDLVRAVREAQPSNADAAALAAQIEDNLDLNID